MTVIGVVAPVIGDQFAGLAEPVASSDFAQLIGALLPVERQAAADTARSPAPSEAGPNAYSTPRPSPKADDDAEPDDTVPGDLIACQILPVALAAVVVEAPPSSRATAATDPAEGPGAPAPQPPSTAKDARIKPAMLAGTPVPAPVEFTGKSVVLRSTSRVEIATILPAADRVRAVSADTLPPLAIAAHDPRSAQSAVTQAPDLQPGASQRDNAPPLAAAPSAVIAPPPVAEIARARTLVPSPAVAPAPVALANPLPNAANPAFGIPLRVQAGTTPEIKSAARPDRLDAMRSRSDPAEASIVATFAAGLPPSSTISPRIDAPARFPTMVEPAPSRIAADIVDAAPGGFDVATDRLGAVRVTLDTSESRVAVQLSAETLAAGQLLAAHPSRLADAVASGGQRLDALAVDVRSGGGQSGRQSPDTPRQSPARPPTANPARAPRADRFA